MVAGVKSELSRAASGVENDKALMGQNIPI